MDLRSRHSERTAVITGVGLAVPGASTPSALWGRLARGIEDAEPQRVEEELPTSSSEDRTIALARLAARRAVEDAGLSSPFGQAAGCSLSSSKGGLLSLVAQSERLNAGGPSALDPKTVLQMFHGGVGGALCAEFGIEGPTANLVAACATGIASLATAKRWIEEERCECVIAGSTEAAIHPFIQSAFARMGVLSQTAPRPLDRDRDGFVMGEGSAAFVVESFSSARRRGAEIHALVSGACVLGDAYHETRMNPSGGSVVRAVQSALRESRTTADAIDTVNLHATGTPAGDPVESTAMHSLFGPRIRTVSLCATKGATGHLLGAAGSVEAVITLLALKHGHVPPTANLKRIDPLCNGGRIFSDYAPQRIKRGLSLSYGFGGHVGALLLERFE